jgi:excisionase family DNA binding protein
MNFLKSPLTTDQEFLTPEDASELLRVSTRTVYEMLRSGKLPAVQYGRQWRIRTADILPKSATDKLEESMQCHLRGEFPKAAYILEEVVKQHPHYGLAYWQLGTIYGYYGNYHDAERAFKESIRLNPDYVPSLHNLGMVYNYLGYGDAIEVLTRAIELDPDHADTYYQLGYAYLLRSKNEEAVKYFQEALSLDPKHLQARKFLAMTFSNMGNSEAAKREDAIWQQLIEERRKEREQEEAKRARQ